MSIDLHRLTPRKTWFSWGWPRAWVIAWAVSLTSPSVFCAQPSPEDAARAIAEERFRDARAIYRQLQRDQPNSPVFAVWIGRLSGWLEDYETAEVAYDLALRLDGHNLEALLGKAQVLLWQRNFSPARALIDEATRLAPGATDVLMMRAYFYYYAAQPALALELVGQVLDVDPTHTEALDLQRRIVLPAPPLEVRLGYGRDTLSSFALPAATGHVSVGFVSPRTRITARHERWQKFGEEIDRTGVSGGRRFGSLWVHGGALLAPEATVLARKEYTVGFSQSMDRVVAGFDYRFLEFSASDVYVGTATVEFHFADRSRLQGKFYQSWTQFGEPRTRVPNQSVLVRYWRPVQEGVVVNVGYARGNESFSAVSIDQLGDFDANTYLGGIQIDLSPELAVTADVALQDRSNGTSQSTFAVGFIIRVRD